MKTALPSLDADFSGEITALIAALHANAQRLEQLTEGEVDTVADREGRTFLLRPAQEHLRQNEAAKQAAIVDALPAHIALLDASGVIILVNEAWRAFARANALAGAEYEIGVNYLGICDSAQGDGATQAGQVAAGIRAVLAGKQDSYSLEYPCHAPGEQRWFLMTVTPLAKVRPHGVVVMHVNVTQRKRDIEEMMRFVAAMDAIADGIFMIDRSTMSYVHVNDAACHQLKLTREVLLALGPMKVMSKTRTELEREIDEGINSGVAQEPIEMLWSKSKDSPVWVELRHHVQKVGDRWTVISLVRDITERKSAEFRIIRLNHVYAVQSGINALIVRVHDREELFREACRIAVEAGAFKTAWIGVIDSQTLNGKVIAWYGADQAYVDSIKLAMHGATAETEPPACRVLRLGQTVICNDIATEPSMEPRRAVLLGRGYKSVACFPLTLNGKPEAVITLVAGERDYFDAEEGVLLSDMAANLSFALNNIAKAQQMAQAAFGKIRDDATLLRFKTAMDVTADAIYLVDRNSMSFIYVNDTGCRMLDLSREEVLALGPYAVQQISRAELERTFDVVIASDLEAEPVEQLRSRKDGSQFWAELRRYAQRSADGWTIITLARDITQRKRAIADLRSSESRFRSLLELSSDWYWEQDESLRFVSISGDNRRDGWDRNQQTWVGLHRWEIPGIVPLNTSWVEHKTLLHAHEAFRNFEYQRLAADGSVRYVSASGEPIFDSDGYFDGYRGVATDITARKAAEARITYLNRGYAMLSGINTLIVRVRDRDELFREASRIAVETGGFRMSLIAMVDKDTAKLVPVATTGKDDELRQAIDATLSSSEEASMSVLARAVSEKKPVVVNDTKSDMTALFNQRYPESGLRSMAVFPLTVANQVVGVFALYASEVDFFHNDELKLFTELAGDIAFAIDHIGKLERLDYLAYYDPLTGLANRNLFLDRLGQHLRTAKSEGHQVAISLIDLERFKNINDSLGRMAGDGLLRQVAEWLTRNAGGDAGLVARISADLFAFVMPVVRRDGNLAGLIQKSMEQLRDHPFRLNDAVFRIAAKVGVALFPDDGADAEVLLRNAEAALKKAKLSGERYMFYTQNMTAAVAGKLTLENQLRQALDNEEFVLHYQPKVNLSSGKVTSAEALIRWNDPRVGLVPPGRFIPILEETGLIYEVGRWAMRQAIADNLRWRARGLAAFRIAVNVSPLQLRNRNFIDEVEHAITIDPLAAGGLELEITESLIMEDVNHSIASLHAIRAMGISVAIDDFGTGFSSLSYLAKLPVDTLKIDRSFVIEMTDGPQGLALVSTVISLAHALKLKVVAEGVETEEQQRLLRLLNCDEMQGYLFSKPVPAEIFESTFLTSLIATDDRR